MLPTLGYDFHQTMSTKTAQVKIQKTKQFQDVVPLLLRID